MEVSVSRSPICHCQVSPTAGCHHDLEGVSVTEVSVVVESGTGEGASSLKGEAGLHPARKDERRKIKRIFLSHMMSELWQIVFVLCKHFVGHLFDLSKGEQS